jgi:hypothetical protein
MKLGIEPATFRETAKKQPTAPLRSPRPTTLNSLSFFSQF